MKFESEDERLEWLESQRVKTKRHSPEVMKKLEIKRAERPNVEVPDRIYEEPVKKRWTPNPKKWKKKKRSKNEIKKERVKRLEDDALMIELRLMANSNPELKKLLDEGKVTIRPLARDQQHTRPVSIKNGFYELGGYLTYGPIDVNYGWFQGSVRISAPAQS